MHGHAQEFADPDARGKIPRIVFAGRERRRDAGLAARAPFP